MTAIDVKRLTKHYGDLAAVAGIDLAVAPGEVFALLGPNGAGKSTTVEILEGYRRRDGGEVRVLGCDPGEGDRAYRERIGIVLQETRLEEQLTPRELFEIYGTAYPRQLPSGTVLEVVGLEDKADARIKTLSGGQQRRVQLGLGLVGDPELVFLDEPTTGFDPSARRQAWDVISNLRALGKTILLTTHYMDEAQYLADRVAIIASGKIVAEGTPDELRSHLAAATTIRFRLDGGFTGDPPLAVKKSGDLVEYESSQPVADLHRLTGWALDHHFELESLSVTRPTLEDVYLDLTDGAESND
jgi:ABC-2 type transport system ATP-binding protein